MNGDALPLTLAAVFVVVSGHLQGQAQQHVLHAFQDDAGDALGRAGQLGQVHHAGDGRSGTRCMAKPGVGW